MPCLFSCFSVSKHKKHRLFIKATSSTDPRFGDHKALLEAKKLENQESVEIPSNTTARSEVNLEAQCVKCSTGNENMFQGLPTEDISDELIKPNGVKEEENSGEEPKKTRVVHESSERKGSQLVPESNDRSQSFLKTHHSLKDLAFESFEEADGTDGDKTRDFAIEESSESLFSLSIDSRKRVSEADFDGEREVTSPITKKETVTKMVEAKMMEDGNQNAQEQVLKPVKVNIEKLQEDYEKENMSVEFETRCQEPMLDLSSKKKKLADKEIAVDTSLSSWLVQSSGANSVENSDSKSRNSLNDKKGRPVLGELNLQEPKTELVCVSKSNARDPNSDDVPLIGTIGSYLSCTEKTRNRMIAL